MSTYQPRKPMGTPAGGQFDTYSSGEGNLSLAGSDGSQDADRFAQWRRNRAEQLEAAGFIAARATPTSTLDPKTTRERKQWWDTEFAAAEYGGDRGDYLQMPDDNTPSRTLGQSLSGHRRTHRMLYSGTDEHGNTTELRMPSRTAIARFSKDNKHPTFDVPVHVAVNGRTRQGWVRVAAGGDGKWETKAVGFEDHEGPHVAEAVNAVLESRRVSTALTGVNLMQRRADRIKAMGTEQWEVSSSWINTLGFQGPDRTVGTDGSGLAVMTTKTKPDAAYGYRMDASTFARFANDPRPGTFFNRNVRGNTERVEVKQCGNCGRFGSAGHRCPSRFAERDVDASIQRRPMLAAARAALGRVRGRTE